MLLQKIEVMCLFSIQDLQAFWSLQHLGRLTNNLLKKNVW